MVPASDRRPLASGFADPDRQPTGAATTAEIFGAKLYQTGHAVTTASRGCARQAGRRRLFGQRGAAAVLPAPATSPLPISA